MTIKPPLEAPPFGLFELNTEGVVVGYSPVKEQYSIIEVQQVLGRNFFTEILPPAQFTEFGQKFRTSMERGEPVERFALSFLSKQGEIELQIALAYLPKQAEKGRARLAIARLLPAPGQGSD